MDEALTLEETILAYTSWAARAAFSEGYTGRLAPGMWADVTVMDIDPFEVVSRDPGELLNGTVLMTVVGGDLVFSSGAR